MKKSSTKDGNQLERFVGILTIPAICFTYILIRYYFSPVPSWKIPDKANGLGGFGMLALLIGILILTLTFLYLYAKVRNKDVKGIVHSLMFSLALFFLLLTIPFYSLVQSWIEINYSLSSADFSFLNWYLESIFVILILFSIIFLLLQLLNSNLSEYMTYFTGTDDREIEEVGSHEEANMESD